MNREIKVDSRLAYQLGIYAAVILITAFVVWYFIPSKNDFENKAQIKQLDIQLKESKQREKLLIKERQEIEKNIKNYIIEQQKYMNKANENNLSQIKIKKENEKNISNITNWSTSQLDSFFAVTSR